jgi:hypothetical protein
MCDTHIRYRQRKFAGKKDRVSFSKRRYLRNLLRVLV